MFSGRETRMATRGSNPKVREHRWRVLIGSVALGVAALGLSGSGIATASASTGATSTGDPSATVVVECNSGTVTNGDIQTSSLFVARVPAGEHPDLPGGCVQTG